VSKCVPLVSVSKRVASSYIKRKSRDFVYGKR
jgi:hypothetical protein